MTKAPFVLMLLLALVLPACKASPPPPAEPTPAAAQTPPPATDEGPSIAGLVPGMTREEAVAVLGAPSEEAPGVLDWQFLSLGLEPPQVHVRAHLDVDGRILGLTGTHLSVAGRTHGAANLSQLLGEPVDVAGGRSVYASDAEGVLIGSNSKVPYAMGTRDYLARVLQETE